MTRILRRLALAVVLLAAACGAPAAAVSTPAAAVSTAPAATASAWPPGFVLPDRHLTPGAVRHDPISMICPHVSHALEALRPDAAVKAQVYAEYGITHHVYGQYEVDHLVPVELDGADTRANLWPEPELHNPKDKLENKLHALVCARKLGLAAAQRAIRTDWRAAYVRYVGKP